MESLPSDIPGNQSIYDDLNTRDVENVSDSTPKYTQGPSDEDKQLGLKSPIRTILTLSTGPLISQTVQAFYGIADSLWVARTIGQKGISVFGAVYIVEFIAVSVSLYLMSSVNIRMSYLFGQHRTKDCSQMYVDFVRLAAILGIVVPCIVLPIVKPMIRWFGANEELVDMSFQYMLPVTAMCFFNFLYMMACGLIQAEGRSLLYGAVQVASFAINMGLFDPLFLVGLKLPIWGASLATIISEAIPGIILTTLILCGKFSLKPKMKMFFQKPTYETWEACKVGFASFIEQISATIPCILMQKYVNMASSAIGQYDVVIAVWAVIEKLYQLVGGICIAFSYGLLPSASYAFGANRMNRVMWLFTHATWISTAISVVMSVIIMTIPGKLALIWDDDPNFVSWCKRMVPKVFYTCVCLAIQYTCPAILQAMNRVAAANSVGVLTLLLPLPIFSSILYFTKKDDPERIMWTYALNDVYSIVMCSVFLIKPGKSVWKEPKDEELELENGQRRKIPDDDPNDSSDEAKPEFVDPDLHVSKI